MTTESLQYQWTGNDILYFLHVPKSAGTSMHFVLSQKFSPEETLEVRHLPNPTMLARVRANFRHHIVTFPEYSDLAINPDANLGRFKFIRGHILYRPPAFKNFRTSYATILRNPVDRLYSEYVHITTYRNNHLHQKVKDFTYDEFLKHDSVLHSMYNVMTRNLFGARAERAESLEQACANLDSMTFVGIAEHFQASMILLHYTYGWKYDYEPVHRNAAKNKNQQPELSEEAVRNLQEITQLDRQLYDYAVNLFKKRMHRMALEVTNNQPDLVTENTMLFLSQHIDTYR
ncbi:MAG: sulfotransferase family 2 domain-containing protein [Anaerolineae bacterium]|nr:sulfotransferase family 2 domain-containing protein [Anaerolineae bacterium]